MEGNPLLMLDPIFLHKRNRKQCYWFNRALFILGDYHLAIQWCFDCWHHGKLIHPETGELLDKPSLLYALDPTPFDTNWLLPLPIEYKSIPYLSKAQEYTEDPVFILHTLEARH